MYGNWVMYLSLQHRKTVWQCNYGREAKCFCLQIGIKVFTSAYQSLECCNFLPIDLIYIGNAGCPGCVYVTVIYLSFSPSLHPSLPSSLPMVLQPIFSSWPPQCSSSISV
jgi:hypothetical protein